MKKIFITGANGNIGEAIKKKFLENNFYVVAPTRQELNLEDIDSISNFFKKNDKDYYAVIHSAGFNNPKLLNEITIEDIEKTTKINYYSFIEIVKAISETMQKKKEGRILAISSLYGTISRCGRLAYTTSKHALNGAMKTFACELGEYNILVNSLSPGFVDTQMTRKNNSSEKIEQLKQKIPLKRLATVDDIANTAYYF